MKQYGSHDPETRVVVDDTTIYEVDMECYYCLTDRERELYYDGIEGCRAAPGTDAIVEKGLLYRAALLVSQTALILFFAAQPL